MAIRAQRFECRQSMKNKKFEIFHYREENPGEVKVHHHDFYEIYFFVGGNARFRVEGRTYRLEPGDLLLINPQELHQPLIEPGSVYERIVLWIDRNYLASRGTDGVSLLDCFDQAGRANLIHPSKVQRTLIQDLLENLTREYYGTDYGSTLCAEGLFVQLMVQVNRLSRQGPGRVLPLAGPDRISRILSYIGTHYNEEITLETLAGEFYVSKYYLSHEFRRCTGTSVYQYVILKRLMQAREMITDGQAPGEVCKVCGFGDYANFYRAFKAEYGVSPREYGLKLPG